METQTSEGQILVSAYRRVEGGRVSNLQKKEIHLDLIAPEDESILALQGLTALRQERIVRLSSRAVEQGAVLTYDDLVHLLSTSPSTVRRDVRDLQRRGLSVPIYQRRGRRAGVLVIPILLAVLFYSEAEGQLSSVFGTTGFDYEYENQQSQSTTQSRQLFQQNYNLGVTGRVLDPRLATFFLSGGFGSNFLGEKSSRTSSLSGNLSLLQAAPYGLTLRAGRSIGAGAADTESSAIGANLRLTIPDWPQVFMDFDRVTIENRSDSRSDASITTGKVRLSHRFWRTMLDAEVGVQSFADQISDISQQRYFARLNNTVTWSPTTTLRSVNDGFMQDDQLVLSSSYFLDNRPDPTLSRTVGISYHSSRSGEGSDHSLNLSGAISKTFVPYPWLQANSFTSATAQKLFGAENTAGVAWSGGGGAVVSYFRPVTLLTDYGLALTYETDIAQPSTTQQVRFGAISRSLQPFQLSGDYYLGFQTGMTQGTRQFVVGRADAALGPGLFLRTFADFLTENTRSSESEGAPSERTVANLGTGVSYRPLFNLNLDLAGNVQWNSSRENSGTIMRLNLLVGYLMPIPGTPTLDISSIWERATVTDDSRLEIKSRLNYRVGQATLGLEYRFERRTALESIGVTNNVRITLTRPFTITFR